MVDSTIVSNSYTSTNNDYRVAKRSIGGADFQLFGNGLVPEAYDEVTLSYTGADVTGVVYKLASATVATLTLGYSGSNLTSVTRT